MKIEKKKISELKPAPYNARKSNLKQDENLKKSLEKFGVVEPIVFNEQTGYIVGGHFRIRELKKLGYKEVDCVIVNLNKEDEKELNIRLNANTGDWDWEMLTQEWNADELEEWGLDLPNYAEGHDINGLSEDELDMSEEYNPIGTESNFTKIVFVFDGKDEADSFLKKVGHTAKKHKMIWEVNLSTQSIL